MTQSRATNSREPLPPHQVTFQVNWDWHNQPSPGFDRNDFVYIIGFGYNLDLWE